MPDSTRGGRPVTARRVRRDGSASFASSPAARRRMQDQRSRDTGPELAVRRLLHSAGLRYRVDRSPLPGLRRRADVVFGAARIAVYIDGCFWHGCPDHGSRPKANAEWWAEKLLRNRERDQDTDRVLRAAGWLSIRAWEHEDPAVVASRVAAEVGRRRTAGRSTATSRPATARAEDERDRAVAPNG